MNCNSCKFAICILLGLLPARLLAQQASAADDAAGADAAQIVRRSVGIGQEPSELARNYTYQQREVRKHLGPHGEVKSMKVETWDVTNLYGEPYWRLIQRDDKGLSLAEENREEEKMQKFLVKCKNESEERRQKRQAKERKERESDWAFLRDVVNAYDFRIAGVEAVDGRPAWVIDATPRKGFRPTQPHGNILAKIKGRIWIDKQDYYWVKAEGEAVDTISLGVFIARIHKGSQFSFEQVRLNDEVWLMRRVRVEIGARVLLVGNPYREVEDTFFNYKKFVSNTRILPGVREAEPK